MPDLKISVDIDARGTKAGADQAKAAIKGVREEAEKTGRSVKSVADQDLGALDKQAAKAAETVKTMSSSLSGVSAAAGVAGVAALGLTAIIVAIGVAVVVAAALIIQLAQKVTQLAKAFADYGQEIAKARVETGLTTQTISALKFQADITGTEFGDLEKSVGKFRETIGQAAAGSDDARKQLKLLGLDGKTAMSNVDGAFKTAVAAIVTAKDPLDQSRKAFAAFGDEGYKLIPFFQSFHGNVDEAIKSAEAYGLVLSGKDVEAAKAFEKSQKEMEASIRSLEITFGREFLDTVKQTIDAINAYLLQNQNSFHTWAYNSGLAVQGLKTDLASLASWLYADGGGGDILRWFTNVATLGVAGRYRELANSLVQDLKTQGAADRFASALSTDNTINFSAAPQTGNRAVPDPAALNAYRAQLDKPIKAAKVKDPGLTDAQKQYNDLQGIIKDLNRQIEFYGDKSQEAAIKQQLLGLGVKDLTTGLAAQAIALAKQIDLLDKNAIADEENARRRKAAAEAFAKAKSEIDNSSIDGRIGLGSQVAALQQQITLGRDLTQVEQQQIDNVENLTKAQVEYANKGFNPEQVRELVDRLKYEQDVTLEIVKRIQALKEEIRVQELNKTLTADLAQEIADLNQQIIENITHTAQSRVEQLLLSDAYKQLTPEMQKARVEQAQQIDSMRAVIKQQELAKRQWQEVYGTIRDSLQTLADQGFGAFFQSILKKFQSFLLDMVAQWLTSKFFQMFYQGGNTAAAQQSGQGGGGILGGIFQGIFGHGAGQGPGGTPTFNPAGGGVLNGGGSGVPPTGTIDANGNYTVNGNQGGGIGSIFGKGGIFGSQGFGNNVGTYSGIGGIANIVGGLIGGRAGSYISNIGTGLATGAQIGSMILPGIGTAVGAAIGAAVGFFATLFGGNPKEKRDNKEKLPALTQGFTDALSQLRQLVQDVRTLRVSPDSALAKAVELRASIASGFGLQFESKKYQKQAQTQIAQRLAEADSIIVELRNAADVARAAGERERRMLPEFAGGVYMSPAFMSFRRQNGLLGGAWTGRDTIPAMLAHGEMVLNPTQQNRVRAAAGFDVFKPAGIPGYAGGGMVDASGGGQPIVLQVSHTIDRDGMVQTAVKSPSGRRVILDVVSDGFANDDLKLKRRGA